MNLVLPMGKLEAEALQRVGADGRLYEIRTRRLEGGYVSAGVYRVDLIMKMPGGVFQEVSFVQKYTLPQELHVHQALNDQVAHTSIPRIVDSGVFEGQTWFIYPYYAGEALSWDDPVPKELLHMMAQVHWRFEGREDEFSEVLRVDRSFLLQCFDSGVTSLASQGELFYQELALLKQIREDEQVYSVLKSLPMTLTHGDVHPGNLIRAGVEQAMLIDWGNARFAPAALDLANMVDFGSPEWKDYLAAWEGESGLKMDERQAELGFCLAEIVVNTQYLPFAVEHLPSEDARRMVMKSTAAWEGIEQLLA